LGEGKKKTPPPWTNWFREEGPAQYLAKDYPSQKGANRRKENPSVGSPRLENSIIEKSGGGHSTKSSKNQGTKRRGLQTDSREGDSEKETTEPQGHKRVGTRIKKSSSSVVKPRVKGRKRIEKESP